MTLILTTLAICYLYFLAVRFTLTDAFPIRNWKDLILLQTSTFRNYRGEECSTKS